MAGFNGSGTFVRTYNWVTDKGNNVKVTASRMDGEDDGFATGLSTAICKDGQTTTTAAVPFAVGINVSDGSEATPSIKFINDTDSGFYRIGANNVGLALAGAKVLDFATATSVMTGSQWAVKSLTDTHHLVAYKFSADANGAYATLRKSRGAAIDGATAPSVSDILGSLRFEGSDGVSSFNTGASVTVTVDATATAASCPARLDFRTATQGNAYASERMRIDSSGYVTITGSNSTGFSGLTDNTGAAFLTIAADGTVANAVNIQEIGNNSAPGTINISKQRGTSVNSNTLVVDADVVGCISFWGADGTHLRHTADISAEIDGTASASVVPMRLLFKTGTTTSASERLRITSTGSVMMSGGLIATNATDGFFYLNSCAGAPTGAATVAVGNAKAMIYDTTNNKLWVYSNSVWRGVALA